MFKPSRFASAVLFLSCAMIAGTAAAVGMTPLTATINTTEFMLPAPQCPSGIGGIGAGAGITNLFTRKPLSQTTAVVMTSSDCITPPADGSVGPMRFSEGKFVLIGVGGDMINATYSGTLIPTAIDAATGIVTYVFGQDTVFNIHGGTGRYARATGAGTISGTELVNPVTHSARGTLQATGSLVY